MDCRFYAIHVIKTVISSSFNFPALFLGFNPFAYREVHASLLYFSSKRNVLFYLTVDKVEHLLRLADEYQTKSVFDVCLNYLKVLPGSKENAVRTLFLTNMTAMVRGDRRLDIVRSGCYNLIKDMSLQDIVKKDDFKNLERDSVESVLVERVKKLEGLVEVVYPQLIGLVEFCLVLCLGPKKQNAFFRSCPEHFNSDHMALEELYTRIKKCTTCRRMIEQLVSHSQQVKSQKGLPLMPFLLTGPKATYKDAKLEHLYGGSHHFDSKLVSVIQDLYKAYRVIASEKASLAGDFTEGPSPKFYFSTSFPSSDFGEYNLD